MRALAAGGLAARLGTGRVVRAGFVLSLFCFASYALVTSFEMLLVVRVLQGVSGGLIYGAAPALGTLSLPPSRHGWGPGWASTGLGLGLSVSPLIRGGPGGALRWRWAVLLRLPLAAALVARLAAEAAGVLLVARCGDGTPLVLVGGALALVGLGLGVFQVPNIAQVMAAFPPRQQGAAGGFTFLSRTSGVVVGVEAAAWLLPARPVSLRFLPAFPFPLPPPP